jgi:hypothetical protein
LQRIANDIYLDNTKDKARAYSTVEEVRDAGAAMSSLFSGVVV